MPPVLRADPRRFVAAAACALAFTATTACESTDKASPERSSPAVASPSSAGVSLTPERSTTPTTPGPGPADSAAPTASSPTATDSTPSTWATDPEDRLAWKSKPRGPSSPNAESIHAQSVPWLLDLESTYGSADGSKCWPERPTMWTAQCTQGATQAKEAARTALQMINKEPATTFTTLRANAARITKAADAYRTGACAADPSSAKARKVCQDNAYIIAQTYTYLRTGFNAALEGR